MTRISGPVRERERERVAMYGIPVIGKEEVPVVFFFVFFCVFFINCLRIPR